MVLRTRFPHIWIAPIGVYQNANGSIIEEINVAEFRAVFKRKSDSTFGGRSNRVRK